MTTELEYAALSAFLYNDQRGGGGAATSLDKLDLPPMERRIWNLPGATSVAFAKTLSMILLIALISGCGNDELSWTEDVRLPDGRTVTLERWAEFKGGSSHLGDPSTESRQRFEFRHPASGEIIRWENAKQQGRLGVIALWFSEGTPKLLTTPLYVGDELKYNCPNPPYLLYEYVGGQWSSKPLAQIKDSRIRANATTHPLSSRETIESSRRHLSTQQTSNSYTYADGVRKVPYLIDLKRLSEQTFGRSNCDRPRNYLILD